MLRSRKILNKKVAQQKFKKRVESSDIERGGIKI